MEKKEERFVDKFINNLGSYETLKISPTGRLAAIPMKAEDLVRLATEYLQSEVIKKIEKERFTDNISNEIEDTANEFISASFDKFFKDYMSGNPPKAMTILPYGVQKEMFSNLMNTTMDYLDVYKISIEVMKKSNISEEDINIHMENMSSYFKDISDAIHNEDRFGLMKEAVSEVLK